MKFKLKGKAPQAPKRVNAYNFKTYHLVASIALMISVFILALMEFGNPLGAMLITGTVSSAIIFSYFMVMDLLNRGF